MVGASRVLTQPLLHAHLLLNSIEERRAKVRRYASLSRRLIHEPGRLLDHVYCPEDEAGLQLERVAAPDQSRIERYLARSRTALYRRGRGAGVNGRPKRSDIERWSGRRVVSADAYSAAITLPHGAERMRAGSLQHLQVEVSNLGSEWWPRGPDPHPVIHVGHRWRRVDGSEIEVATPRTAFTETVAPGQTTRLTMAVQAPPESGELELVVDVVHELVRWFGCETTTPVSVGPPYSSAFFREHRTGARNSASVIVPRLIDVIKPASIVDLGCGSGAWFTAFNAEGVTDVLGLDGTWVDEAELEIPGSCFRAVDLDAPVDVGRRFDLALALEVAEHLPERSAEVFVDSLTRLRPSSRLLGRDPGSRWRRASE
jgi:methyltransferase family protein